jgi:hypothetical protein
MHFIQQTKKKWLKNEDILSMGIYCLGERKLIQGTKQQNNNLILGHLKKCSGSQTMDFKKRAR